jgi:hypothetical protein
MLYRKQVVLASQDALRRDMSHLSNILNLLYISQKSPLKDVTQAPILNIPPVSPEEEKRLDVLRVTAAGCHNQAAALANRMDSLIATYQQEQYVTEPKVTYCSAASRRASSSSSAVPWQAPQGPQREGRAVMAARGNKRSRMDSIASFLDGNIRQLADTTIPIIRTMHDGLDGIRTQCVAAPAPTRCC